jgi:hypothetical protein
MLCEDVDDAAALPVLDALLSVALAPPLLPLSLALLLESSVLELLSAVDVMMEPLWPFRLDE